MFVGREKELRVLENEYNKKGFSMTILYGRRRIGKSTLLLEFIKRKKTIFYTASRVGAVRNLELLSQQVIQTLAPNMSGVSFSSIENLFSFRFHFCFSILHFLAVCSILFFRHNLLEL